MKFSTPGHSCIQEVDNIHSNIEKTLQLSEVWSPVSLPRVIFGANRKNPYTVIELQSTDFLDFQTQSKNLNYKDCPYTQVCQLKISSNDLLSISFKTSHKPTEWFNVDLFKDLNDRKIAEEGNLNVSFNHLQICLTPFPEPTIILALELSERRRKCFNKKCKT